MKSTPPILKTQYPKRVALLRRQKLGGLPGKHYGIAIEDALGG